MHFHLIAINMQLRVWKHCIQFTLYSINNNIHVISTLFKIMLKCNYFSQKGPRLSKWKCRHHSLTLMLVKTSGICQHWQHFFHAVNVDRYHWFWLTWGWVNDGGIFMFGGNSSWTSLTVTNQHTNVKITSLTSKHFSFIPPFLYVRVCQHLSEPLTQPAHDVDAGTNSAPLEGERRIQEQANKRTDGLMTAAGHSLSRPHRMCYPVETHCDSSHRPHPTSLKEHHSFSPWVLQTAHKS